MLSITCNTEQFTKVLNGRYVILGYSEFSWDNVYKETWEPVNGEMLHCLRKLDNTKDRYVCVLLSWYVHKYVIRSYNAKHV